MQTSKLFTLPNLLTLSNLFCGSLAVIGAILNLHYPVLMGLIFLSLFFDFLDGMVARKTGQNSDIGIQLDSLADVISFGLFPGILMLKLLGFEYHGSDGVISYGNMHFPVFSFLGLFITLFSALRLAKFNLDTEQKNYFKGLPTPANTIFILAIYCIIIINPDIWFNNAYILLGITAMSCYLLISNIPLFALKFKNFSWKDNELQISFLIISIILLSVFHIYAIPVIIILYILLSIIFKKSFVKKS